MKMKFVRRTTPPEHDNKYYIHYSKGGYNTCVMVNEETGSVLPNCVGYAHGRYLESMGAKGPNWKVPNNYAEDFIDRAIKNGLAWGMTPKLGSIGVWSAGNKHNLTDGAGHVMFVENVDSIGNIDCSASEWEGRNFYTTRLTKESGYIYNSSRKLEGFIYPIVDFDEETPTSNPSTSPIPEGTIYRVQVGAFSIKDNAIRRAKELKSKGFDVIIKYVDGNYKPQVGAYEVRRNAELMLSKVKSMGYSAFITTQGGPEIPF